MTTFITRRSAPLLAALALLAHPAHAQQDRPRCLYREAATVALHYAGDPLVPAIESTINGQPAVMLMSTGMFGNVLTMTGAVRHHLPLSEDSRRYVELNAGRSNLYVAKLDSFSVGPSRAANTEIDVLRASTSPVNDGFIGANNLFQFDLEIALAEKKIKFFKASGSACDGTFLAYWDRDAVVVPAAPGERRHLNPHFTVELNGHSFDAVISSGSPRSWVDRRVALRAGAKFDPAAGPGQQSSASFDKLSIGNETIANPQLYVVDRNADVGAEVNLGADFLRTHRVLFAGSQRKLYISYVGGTVFGPHQGIEPWVQREADAGNRDAELALYRAYLTAGGGAQAGAWLYKAAAHGQPTASFQVGRNMLTADRYAEAAVYLRRAIDELPSDLAPAAWLYLARVRLGDTEYAKRELAHLVPPQEEQSLSFLAAFFFGDQRPWPLPVADYYLGRIDEASLLARAAKQHDAEERVREAKFFVNALREAQAGGHSTTAKPVTVLMFPPPPASPAH